MDYKSKIRKMVKEELLKFLEADAEEELKKRKPIGDLPRKNTMGSVKEEEDESLCEEEELEEAGDVQYGEKHKSIKITKKGTDPKSTFYTAKVANQVHTRKDRKSLERLLKSKGFTRIT